MSQYDAAKLSSYGSFGAIPLLPSALAIAARAALGSQGYNPNIISPSGEIDPQALLALAYDRIELRTSLFDKLVINLNSPSDPATQAMMNRIQPSITFVGRAGRFEIAPYGVATGIDRDVGTWGWKIGAGIGAALLGLLLVGKAYL